MRKYLYVLTILFTVRISTFAQQQPQFSHYSFNGMYLSPAYAGITDKTEINMLYRYQWAGYNASFDGGGAPKTGLISISLPVRFLGGGVGLYATNDRLGATESTSAALAYSAHIKVGTGKLGIGIQGNLTNIKKGDYRPNDPGDPSVPENSSDSKYDIGAGLWYQSSILYIGGGINNLLQSKFRFEDSARNETSGFGLFTARNHAYLTAGYYLNVSPAVTVVPTAIVKYDLNKLSVEAGGRAILNEKYYAGVGYRHQEAVTGMAGIYLLRNNALQLGYAFDLTTFNPEAKALTSHEIILSYSIPRPANIIKPIIRTPRYSF
ncbi:PorP/SprF family type IX secretion system membrane protein [Adhaeribacter radiodurans]|uniref:PorP/SprF family type IX secretion system membrane protein n=1 Tax=Adhaeribacter radiodurans TaxID=2745197 RepID=A0A7L7L263_9BACT|nr:PorP/SprF family type IX secretion system membrane protein [Adhaeribacter radiodurans]QMU26888.1 PorP/SprF family type IX secretion system membrane protein [Adhaeribacter radiodurans]